MSELESELISASVQIGFSKFQTIDFVMEAKIIFLHLSWS